MNKMKKNITILFTIALIVFTVVAANAQPLGPGGGSGPTPFGFVEILIGAGALFGAQKAYDAKKEK